MKTLSFLALFFSKIKTVDIFNFLSVRYFSKGLLFLKTWHIRANYWYNYRPSNLLFRFFRCHLSHLHNRQTKIAENLTIHFFESQHQIKCLVKVSSCLTRFFEFFFETCREQCFASWILSNEGNIKASILLILLKFIDVGRSNENESFTGRFQITGRWICY